MKNTSVISGRGLRGLAYGFWLGMALSLAACGGGGETNPVLAPGAGSPPSAGTPAPAAPTPSTPPVVASARAWDAGANPNMDFASEVHPPSVAVSAKGLAAMAWLQRDSVGGDAERLYVSTAPAGTNSWSTPHLLAQSRTIGLIQRNAVFQQGSMAEPTIKIVSHEATGDVWVLWRERTSLTTSPNRLMWARYDAAAKRWSEAALLGEVDLHMTQVVTSRAGHVAVAWGVDRQGTRLVVVAPDGQTVTRYENPRYLVNARMVVDDTGRVSAAFLDSQQLLLAQAGTPSWENPVALATGVSTGKVFHDMAVSPEGELLMVWTQSDGRLAGVRGPSAAQLRALPALRVEQLAYSPSLQWTSQGWVMALASSKTLLAKVDDYLYALPWLTRLGADDRWLEPTPVQAADAGGVDWLQLLANDDGSLQVVVRGEHVASYVLAAGQTRWLREGVWQGVPTPRLAHDRRSGRTVLVWQTPGQLHSHFRRLTAGG